MRKLQNVFGVTKGTEEHKFSITKEIFLEMYSQVGKTHARNKKRAPMIIYDFPRHDEFYSSHPTYLAYGAVYIIVLDGSKQLDYPCPYEQYLPGKSGLKTSRGIHKNILIEIYKICFKNIIKQSVSSVYYCNPLSRL